MRHLVKLLALLSILQALPAAAHDGLHIADPYARILTTGAGVVYFTIENHTGAGDTLIAVRSDIGTAMLMSSVEDTNGVMKMSMAMDGFAIGPADAHVLQPAGDHVMLSNLTRLPGDGKSLVLTLTFARAGEVTLTVPVANARRTAPGPGPTPFDAQSD